MMKGLLADPFAWFKVVRYLSINNDKVRDSSNAIHNKPYPSILKSQFMHDGCKKKPLTLL